MSRKKGVKTVGLHPDIYRELERVKVEMSYEEGRPLSFSEVIKILIHYYRAARG